MEQLSLCWVSGSDTTWPKSSSIISRALKFLSWISMFDFVWHRSKVNKLPNLKQLHIKAPPLSPGWILSWSLSAVCRDVKVNSSACPVACVWLEITLDNEDLTVLKSSYQYILLPFEQVRYVLNAIPNWSLQSFMTSFCHPWQRRLFTVSGTCITKCTQRNAWETVCWTWRWKKDCEEANTSHRHILLIALLHRQRLIGKATTTRHPWQKEVVSCI